MVAGNTVHSTVDVMNCKTKASATRNIVQSYNLLDYNVIEICTYEQHSLFLLKETPFADRNVNSNT